jgi:anti-sigma regulatory factor (Ser/Thr protein kinase)
MTAVREAGDRFRHEALMYRGDAGFVSGVSNFVRDGLHADETVAVAAPAPHLDMLRDELGADANAVLFMDMEQLGGNPGRIIDRWQRLVEEHLRQGRRGFRGVGEPAWVGRRSVEYVECQLHEHLLNRAFDDGPGWRLMCPYDEVNLPPAVVTGATHTHPLCSDDAPSGPQRSPAYAQDGALDLFAAPLPAPPADATARRYDTSDDVAAVRHRVAALGRQSGLDETRVADLCLATSELATNSLRHGAGSGHLTMWRQADAVVVQISDGGHITDPLIGRRAPDSYATSGRGLYLTHQLCDLVQLRSSPAGTTVRLTAWIDPA